MSQEDTFRDIERRIFKALNTWFMAPLLRRGLGWLIGSPASGYFMLLRTTGRKSGQPRETPLNYAIVDGWVVCLAGFGSASHWLANIRSQPRVAVRLPARALEGTAELVADEAEAAGLALRVARNSGFALVFEDPRCLLMGDDELRALLRGRPVVRIRPDDGPLAPGPHDPDGRGWLIPLGAQALGALALAALLRRRRQG